jgi:uncharacterized protein YggT (Ycf19 family)
MSDLVVFFLKSFVNVIISLLQIAMFARAILSWFIDPMNEGGIVAFLTALTEPVILPVRALCAKMHWFEGMPLDVPFLITVLLLAMIQSLIGIF